MAMRRRRFPMRMRRRNRRRTLWVPITPIEVVDIPNNTVALHVLDGTLPDASSRAWTFSRLILNLFHRPSALGTLPHYGAHTLMAGLIVLPQDEVDSFPVSTAFPDPDFPSRQFIHIRNQGMWWGTTDSGIASDDDVVGPYNYLQEWDVTQLRRVNETDRLCLVTHVYNESGVLGPTANTNYGFNGRFLATLP